MAITHSHYVKWIHMLAWKAMDTGDLSPEEQKAIGIFIGHVKSSKYISEKNTLLLKVAGIVDAHTGDNCASMPLPKTQYNADEKKQIRKGIRELYKIADDGTAVWQFCHRFLFSKTGKRRTKAHSENRYWHAQMTLAINAD